MQRDHSLLTTHTAPPMVHTTIRSSLRWAWQAHPTLALFLPDVVCHLLRYRPRIWSSTHFSNETSSLNTLAGSLLYSLPLRTSSYTTFSILTPRLKAGRLIEPVAIWILVLFMVHHRKLSIACVDTMARADYLTTYLRIPDCLTCHPLWARF